MSFLHQLHQLILFPCTHTTVLERELAVVQGVAHSFTSVLPIENENKKLQKTCLFHINSISLRHILKTLRQIYREIP